MHLMLILGLIFIFCSGLRSSLFLFVLACFLLSAKLSFFSSLLSLLLLLIYIGGLIVLMAYFWMFLPFQSRFALSPLFYLRPLLFFSSSGSLVCGSLSQYLLSSSVLLFFGFFLFIGLVTVVYVVNLSEGRFSS
jgi:hypothetical protein